MTANNDLQRRLAGYYASEPPLRAPDWVLQSALETIEDTRQRRGLVALRRYSDMPQLKLAAAAAIVIAVGAFALWQLAPPGVGPAPSPSPTAAPTPTPTAPSTPEPTTYVAPALTGTFTSALHGLSLSHPEGWTVQAATEPWTNPAPPSFGEASGDFLFDPARSDHLFLGAVSQPLGGTSFDDWLTDFLTAEGCTRTDALIVAGADRATATDCGFALASSQGRGYLFVLHTSPDDVDLRAFDSDAWLEEILATAELRPEDAVDSLPTPSP